MINPYQLLLSRRSDVFPEPVYQWSVIRYDTHEIQMFDSREQAIIYKNHLSVPSQIFWHFFEKQLARLDFRHEPQASLDQLMKDRALELRETYRYLRLWLSGGSDSMTALTAFVKNRIPIDEIVMHVYDNDDINRQAVHKKLSVVDIAIPYVQQNLDHLRHTKITMYRSNLETMSRWHVDPDQIGKVNHLDGQDLAFQFMMPTAGAMALIPNPMAHDWCDIVGGQKTKICLRNNRWYAYDIDTSVAVSARSPTTEDFFISKTIPTLYLKTVWQLKKVCESRSMTSQQIDDMCTLRNQDLDMRRFYNMAMGRIPLPECAYHKHSLGDHARDESEFVRMSQSMDHPVYKIFKRNKKILMADTAFMSVTGHLSRFYCLNDGMSYDSHGIW